MQTERWEQHGHTIAPRGRNRDVLVQSYGNILSEAGCERNFDRDTSFPLTPGARAASRRRRQLGAVYEGHSVPSRSTPCTPKRPRKNHTTSGAHSFSRSVSRRTRSILTRRPPVSISHHPAASTFFTQSASEEYVSGTMMSSPSRKMLTGTEYARPVARPL